MMGEMRTPYDEMAQGELLRQKRGHPLLLHACKAFFYANLHFWNIVGHVLGKKTFSREESQRFLSRPVNYLGGNVLADYPIAQYYQSVKFQRPLLEIGIADGQSSSIFYPHTTVDEGIEYVAANIKSGNHQKTYRNISSVSCASAYDLPFSNEQFGMVLMNSVIHHLDKRKGYALPEIYRILKTNGDLIFSTQSQNFFLNRSLLAQSLQKFGCQTWAQKAAKRCHQWFQKTYTRTTGFDPDIWRKILDDNGFELVSYQNIMSPLESFFYTQFYTTFSRYQTQHQRTKNTGPKWPQHYPGVEKLFYKILNQSQSDQSGSLLFIHARKRG